MKEQNNQPQKEITLDDLALMVDKGFNDVNEKMTDGFKNVNERLGKVEVRLDTLENDVETIKTTTGNIEANLNKKIDKVDYNALTYRVEKLEEKFA